MREKDEYAHYRKRIVKNRCTACHSCPMGVVGCSLDTVPHGHGGGQTCPECGVPYYKVHPHSLVCSRGTLVDETLVHDNYQLKHQLRWSKIK